jgi:hypothetical protein
MADRQPEMVGMSLCVADPPEAWVEAWVDGATAC